MGMWTQKHHHCSISLTSRRLILTPQLFPGILTHSIHSHWSHRDTNTEPLWKLQRENHSRSEPASAQAEGHTTHPQQRGSPGPGQESSSQTSHHSKGEKRKSLGCNIGYQGFLHHSTPASLEHPRSAQHKNLLECLESLTNSDKLVGGKAYQGKQRARAQTRDHTVGWVSPRAGGEAEFLESLFLFQLLFRRTKIQNLQLLKE